MLKKLYKHEFYSLFRTMLPIYAALIGFALLSRVSYLFDSSLTALNILQGFSTTIYIFSIIAMFIVGLVIIVKRFYTNLLSHEGYLTFTLPFSATQHITCKMLCGVAVMAINFVLMIASLLILGAGTKVLDYVFEALRQGFNMASDYYSTSEIVLVIAEFIVALFLGAFQSLLMFYASMAIGQQFKNKIGGAVVSYICIYAAIELIASILMAVIAIPNYNKIEAFFNAGIQSVNIFMIVTLLFSACLSVAFFFITRFFLTNKLNLE